MRFTVLVFVALSILAVPIWWFMTYCRNQFFVQPGVVSSSRTNIQFDRSKIKEIKELELLVLPYGDIKYQSYATDKGREVAFAHYMYNGLGQLTLDLEKVSWEEVWDPNSCVTNLVVKMPEVKVGGAKVLHHSSFETNEYEWVSGIIGDYKESSEIKLGEIERSAREDAQKWIEGYMLRPENIKAARKQAESILRVMLAVSVDGEIKFVWPALSKVDAK